MSFFARPVKPDASSDEVLLNNYRTSGDIAVLGRLFERYMPLVFGVCLKYLGDQDAAKDAVMGIFEELIVKLRQHEVKVFRSWLYVLSRNYCLMQLRAGRRIEEISLDQIMESAPFLHPPGEGDNKEETMKALERCMEKLNTAQKQSIELFYLQEKCYKQIADITGRSLGDVKSYIQNGKRNLKLCMDRNGG
jgi:RNA polymerase sigma factor (sigma-70 family)